MLGVWENSPLSLHPFFPSILSSPPSLTSCLSLLCVMQRRNKLKTQAVRAHTHTHGYEQQEARSKTRAGWVRTGLGKLRCEPERSAHVGQFCKVSGAGGYTHDSILYLWGPSLALSLNLSLTLSQTGIKEMHYITAQFIHKKIQTALYWK